MGFWAALLPRRHGRVYKTSAMAHAHPRKAGVVRSTLAKRPCARARMRKWLLGLAAVLLVPSGSHEAVHDRSGPRFTRRPHGIRVPVDRRTVRVMDGDSAEIRWSPADVETVRVLGIDTPELFVRDRGEPESRNTAGYEGRGFARGAFAVARSVELARAEELDRYGRTLGYFFLDGRNYSVLAIEAGMARETISRFGDNGFPREAAEVRDAARSHESPWRRR